MIMKTIIFLYNLWKGVYCLFSHKMSVGSDASFIVISCPSKV